MKWILKYSENYSLQYVSLILNEFSICTSPIILLVCPPPSTSPPQIFCITFILISPVGIVVIPREINENTYAKFLGGVGGGAKKVYYWRQTLAEETASKCVAQNSPIEQLVATPTQSLPRPKNGLTSSVFSWRSMCWLPVISSNKRTVLFIFFSSLITWLLDCDALEETKTK